jgi:hypothetical protein
MTFVDVALIETFPQPAVGTIKWGNPKGVEHPYGCVRARCAVRETACLLYPDQERGS